MAHGTFTAGAASGVAVPADSYRDQLVIQKTNTTAIALGIGIAAESGKGIQMARAGDTVIIWGPQAELAIYAIGNGGTGTWQDGHVEFYPGPYVP